MLIQTNYNPDVLSCLANLSSDEVFTPPELANQYRKFVTQVREILCQVTMAETFMEMGQV